jgi:excisionase family DNA binding protein
MTELDSLLDAKGAAELLNVPPSWILAEARADRIPHLRLGRLFRFDGDEVPVSASRSSCAGLWTRAGLRLT